MYYIKLDSSTSQIANETGRRSVVYNQMTDAPLPMVYGGSSPSSTMSAIDKAVTPNSLADFIKVKPIKGRKALAKKITQAADDNINLGCNVQTKTIFDIGSLDYVSEAEMLSHVKPVKSDSVKKTATTVVKSDKDTATTMIVSNDETDWPALSPSPNAKNVLSPTVKLTLPFREETYAEWHSRWLDAANLVASRYYKSGDSFFDEPANREKWFALLPWDTDYLLGHYEAIRNVLPEELETPSRVRNQLPFTITPICKSPDDKKSEVVLLDEVSEAKSTEVVSVNDTPHGKKEDVIQVNEFLEGSKRDIATVNDIPKCNNQNIVPIAAPKSLKTVSSIQKGIESKRILPSKLLAGDDETNWPKLAHAKPPTLSKPIVLALPRPKPVVEPKILSPATMAARLLRYHWNAFPDMSAIQIAEALVKSGVYAREVARIRILTDEISENSPNSSILSEPVLMEQASASIPPLTNQDYAIYKTSSAIITPNAASISLLKDTQGVPPETIAKASVKEQQPISTSKTLVNHKKPKLSHKEHLKAEKAKKKASNVVKHKAKAVEEKLQQKRRTEARVTEEETRLLAIAKLKILKEEAEVLAQNARVKANELQERKHVYHAAQINHLSMQATDMALQDKLFAIRVQSTVSKQLEIVAKENSSRHALIQQKSASQAQTIEEHRRRKFLNDAHAFEKAERVRYEIASLESDNLCPIACLGLVTHS